MPTQLAADGSMTIQFDNNIDYEHLQPWEGSWSIYEGKLHTLGDKNAPLWLKTPLPDEAIISFDMTPTSSDIDLKVELYGDGLRHESGYIVILGGWKNTLTVIARQNEHEKTRFEKKTTWPAHQKMHVEIIRANNELKLTVNNTLVGSYRDASPLKGPRHRYMAFNSWKSPGYFDNLVIKSMSGHTNSR